jgi:glycosyltransferase involved in cell wall biosynthesis
MLAFTAFPAPTGAATRLAQRVTAFAEAGHALDVLSPKTPELPHVSKLLGARILRVPMLSDAPGERLGAFERAVRRQLVSSEYDVVHTFDPYSAPAVLDLRGSAKLVVELGGGTPRFEGEPGLDAELRKREREAIRGADAVLAPTRELALRAKGLGAHKRGVHLVRPAADLTLFAPPVDRRRRSTSPVRIAVTASTLSARELALLTEALLIVPSVLEIRATISAELDAEARRALAGADLDDRLELAEPVLYEDLGPFYGAADLGLVVSGGPVRGELPPVRLQAVAEMMASGLALVLPDVPAIREICDARHALLVPPADAEALAGAIQTLVTDPTRRRHLGQAARARAAELLDERQLSARLLALFGTLVAPTIEVSENAFLDPAGSAPSVAPTPSGVAAPASQSGVRIKRPALTDAARPDEATAPDEDIHGRPALASLASAASTEPEGRVPARKP